MKFKYKLSFLKDRSIVKLKKENSIKCDGRVRLSKVRISGENNTLIIESGARINKSNISISGSGNKVIIGKNCDLNNLSIIMDNKDGLIEIGEKTTCGKTQIVSLETYPIKIGRDCMISYDVEIRNTDSHKMYDLKNKNWINQGKEVIIGDNVWIGTRNLILKGTKIGSGSIVAAASIVTKEFSKNVLIGGVPGKEIKKDICWDRESVVPK